MAYSSNYAKWIYLKFIAGTYDTPSPPPPERFHIFQLSQIIRETPRYSTSPPVSRIGHRISCIKSTFELFCPLVWNLAHFPPKLETSFDSLGHPLFFLRLPSNAFPDIGSVGPIENKKKNLKKKSQEVLE